MAALFGGSRSFPELTAKHDEVMTYSSSHHARESTLLKYTDTLLAATKHAAGFAFGAPATTTVPPKYDHIPAV